MQPPVRDARIQRVHGIHEHGVLSRGRNTRPLRRVQAGGWRITEKLYFPGRVMAPHAHDDVFVTFMLAGAIQEASDGRDDILRPGSWTTKPAGVVHANRVGTRGARVLEFTWTGSGPAPALRYAWLHGGAEACTFLQVFCAMRREDRDAAAAVAGLCRGAPFETPAERPRHVPPWIGAVRERLYERNGGASSLAGLAAEFGVHPTYLARVFRRRFGRSIGEHTREMRVVRAARLMARRDAPPLCEIALASGFADQSHLTRAFRAHLGATPASYRRWIGEDVEAPAGR